MFERDILQYMVFMSMKSTAPMLSDVPVGGSLKIKLLGFVNAKNSVEACEVAIGKYQLKSEDLALLSACLIEVYVGSKKFLIHKHSSKRGIQAFVLGVASDDVIDEIECDIVLQPKEEYKRVPENICPDKQDREDIMDSLEEEAYQ